MRIFPNPNSTLAQAFAQHATAHPGQSGAFPPGQGKEVLAARVALAGRAEVSLDVQCYNWHNETSIGEQIRYTDDPKTDFLAATGG